MIKEKNLIIDDLNKKIEGMSDKVTEMETDK